MEYKKDDLITLVIDDMGIDGEGIGKKDGFAFFVKDSVIGDKIEAKIMKACLFLLEIVPYFDNDKAFVPKNSSL